MSHGQDRIGRIRAKYDIGKDRRVGLLGFASIHSKIEKKNPRDIVVVANTDDIDLDNEIVVPSGGDLKEYRARKANFLDHRYDFPHHVGFMRSIRLADDGRALVNRSQIFDNLKSPLADDLLTVAKTVGIGSSIGYEELEGSPPSEADPARYQKAGWITRKWSMIELSFTAMPCNTPCRGGVESEDDIALAMAGLDELVTKSRIRLETAVALGLPHRKVFAAAGTAGAKKRLMMVFQE